MEAGIAAGKAPADSPGIGPVKRVGTVIGGAVPTLGCAAAGGATGFPVVGAGRNWVVLLPVGAGEERPAVCAGAKFPLAAGAAAGDGDTACGSEFDTFGGGVSLPQPTNSATQSAGNTVRFITIPFLDKSEFHRKAQQPNASAWECVAGLRAYESSGLTVYGRRHGTILHASEAIEQRKRSGIGGICVFARSQFSHGPHGGIG